MSLCTEFYIDTMINGLLDRTLFVIFDQPTNSNTNAFGAFEGGETDVTHFMAGLASFSGNE